MDRLAHAHLARELIKACGGVEAAAAACRIGKSQLSDCQSPGGEAYLPQDVIFDLEEYAGRPIVSKALFEARPEPAPDIDLVTEAMEASEAALDLQRGIRLATKDGLPISPAKRRELMVAQHIAERELRDVGLLLERCGDGGG